MADFWYYLIIFLVFFSVIKGLYRCFRKAPVAAVLLLIFFFPALFIWAIVEIFRGPKKDERVVVVSDGEK